MSQNLWTIFRKSRRISFSILAVISLALASLFIAYVSQDFSRFTAMQRGIMISLLLVYALTAIYLYLLVVVVFRPGWEFVRAGILLLLYGGSSALLTVTISDLPCMFGAGKSCRNNFVIAIISWSACAIILLHVLVLAGLTIFAQPFEHSTDADDTDGPPTPSIRGLKRDSQMSRFSNGQNASTSEKRRTFRLSRPPPLRKTKDVPPTAPSPAWTLSPRAQDHYSRMGMPISASRPGSSYSEQPLLYDASAQRVSHSHSSSNSSTNESIFRYGPPQVTSPTPSAARLLPLKPEYPRGVPRDISAPRPSRASVASSVYSVNTITDGRVPDELSPPLPPLSAPYNANPGLPRAPPSSRPRPRQTPAVAPYNRTPPRAFVGLPSRPSTPAGSSIGAPSRPITPSGLPTRSFSPAGPPMRVGTPERSDGDASMRIGMVQASRPLTNGPGRSFHSMTPSLQTVPYYPAPPNFISPLPPSLVPGGGSRSVRFIPGASTIP